MNPRNMCLVLAKYEALQQSRVLGKEMARMRKLQKEANALTGQKAQVATELARYFQNQILTLERLQQLNEMLFKIDTLEGLDNFKAEIAKEVAAKSLNLPGDPGSKRKRSGGKRTRKKRRKRGKTKRNKKYRKKTKGRKRRRKKRTRRK
jgi:hypothetical protein